MELYLLKSAAILAILFTFYKLVMENTSIHNFKRFYLLGSLLASLLIPLITFTNYVEVSPVLSIYTEGTPQLVFTPSEETVNYWPFVLWTIYTFGVLFFSVKFLKNLFNLIQKIKRNPKYRNSNFINVLLKENIIPHTFFSYIFLNKRQFENGDIPQEVMLHEQTHAIQKHSLDVIFVEILQILFWFNPLFYFLKRSIKLNHEFLADRSVLNAGTETSEYQKILLAFSSNVFTPALAHSINYSFIKKRFTVMKTHTSKRAIWLRSLLLLPLLSILIYGFSTKEVVAKQVKNNIVNATDTIEDIRIVIDKNSQLTLNGIPVNLENLKTEINKHNTHLSPTQKQKYLSANVGLHSEKDNDLVENIIEILYASNYRNLSIYNLKNMEDAKLDTNFIVNSLSGKTVEEAEILYQERLKENEKFKIAMQNTKKDENNPWSIDVGDEVERIEITGKIIHQNSTIEFNGKIIQKNATKSEIAEYNKLAEKYNAIAIEKRIIPLKVLKVLETIYRKMTDEQKTNAEPFPECLPSPKSAAGNSTENQNESLNNATIYYKNKVITLEEANDLVAKNKVLSMNVIKLDDGKRKVIITEKPILDKKAPEPQKSATAPTSTKNNNISLNISRTKESGMHFNTQPNTMSTMYYYEGNLIPFSKLHKLMSENINLKMYITEESFGHSIVTLSEKPILGFKEISTEETKTPLPENENLYMAAEAPPVPNPNPVEYIKELAKRGAIFYIGPNKYTRDEAIEIVKKSTNDVTIDVSKYPLVYLGGC